MKSRKKSSDMKKVVIGITKLYDRITKKKRAYKYSDIQKKIDWVNNPKYFPYPYDLMYLKVKGLIKEIPGWWTGEKWDGMRIKKEYKIIEWKRQIGND